MAVVTALITLSACQNSQPLANNSPITNQVPEAQDTSGKPTAKEVLIWQKATVSYIPHSGGFYGLVTEKGKKLLPISLPKKAKQDGILVNVYGKELIATKTSQQWGVPFEIKQINVVK